MKTEIYECDRCHKKATTKEERDLLGLGTVCVGFQKHYVSGGEYQVYAAHQTWTKELCRACRAEIGCLEDKIAEARLTDKPVDLTLEDIVREIVRQEILP